METAPREPMLHNSFAGRCRRHDRLAAQRQLVPIARPAISYIRGTSRWLTGIAPQVVATEVSAVQRGDQVVAGLLSIDDAAADARRAPLRHGVEAGDWSGEEDGETWSPHVWPGRENAVVTTSARDLLLERFEWVGGHADMWPVFRNGDAFRTVVAALVSPFRDAEITAVCGIESRGFLLGGAAALHLGVGFVAVRKACGLFPGEKLVRETEPDYRGIRHALRLQRASVKQGDRVLLVDDWIETGSQALAVRELLRDVGAELAGCAVIVDQVRPDNRRELGQFHAVVTDDELPAV